MFGPVKGVISVTAALFARACQHGRCTRKRGPANSRTYKAIRSCWKVRAVHLDYLVSEKDKHDVYHWRTNAAFVVSRLRRWPQAGDDSCGCLFGTPEPKTILRALDGFSTDKSRVPDSHSTM